MGIPPTIQATRQSLGRSATLKLTIISILALVLLIPVTMVKSLIRERELRQEEVIEDINAKWGRSQTIIGPIISIPFKKYLTDQGGKRYQVIDHLELLPDTLAIRGEMVPEVRYRGIYESVLYTAELAIECSFPAPDVEALQISPQDMLWSKASIGIGISDMRGIKGQIEAAHDGVPIPIKPGQENSSLFPSGVKADLNMASDKRQHRFSFLLKLNGSQAIHFSPVGKTTIVSVQSTWKDPSFVGDFLPVEHRMTDQGFSATWHVISLNRNYPQQWEGNAFNPNQSLFGVKLFKQVDLYQRSMRTAKYALLFIAFTFYAFFLVEILNRLRVHPVQYLLIGFAMIMFYTLLLSVSEHIRFNLAYLISAVAVVLLISLYTKSISRSKNVSLTVGGILTLLYGYCFILLQLEDYALVMGSGGLFGVLAVIMYLTRKIDWYVIHQKVDAKMAGPASDNLPS